MQKKLTMKPNSKKSMKPTPSFLMLAKKPPMMLAKMLIKIIMIITILPATIFILHIIWMRLRCLRPFLEVDRECIMLTNIILVDLEVLVTLPVSVTKCHDLSFTLADSFFFTLLAMLCIKYRWYYVYKCLYICSTFFQGILNMHVFLN